MAKVATTAALMRARREDEVRPEGRAPLWCHFRPGQLLEISGRAPGKLSTAARLVVAAQAEGEPAAWVCAREEASFYPPDFAEAGVDLEALVVVRVPKASGAHALVRASEVLLRSGAFGLLVLDFGGTPVPRGELAWQARLSGVVRMHEARVVLLTSSCRTEPSLGPLIGLRVEPELRARDDALTLAQHVLKSKLGVAAEVSLDLCAPPPGALPALRFAEGG